MRSYLPPHPSVATPAMREIFLFSSGSILVTLVLVSMDPSLLNSPDYLKMHFFNKYFFRQEILQGHLPLWNPYVYLGRPFLADIETAFFYPPNLLFLLGPRTGLILSSILHFFLGAYSMAKLAVSWRIERRWALLIGFAFILSGPLIGRLLSGQIQYVYALCYWPLLFLVFTKLTGIPSMRTWLLFILVVALQFLCGHPQIFWITALGLGLFYTGSTLSYPSRQNLLAFGKGAVLFVSAYVFALALCAPQLFPFLELVAEGNRIKPSVIFASSFSLPWTSWLLLFIPVSPSTPINWENTLFLGGFFSLAGILGLVDEKDRRIRGLILMMTVSAVIAHGEDTPLFALFYHILPGLSGFRIPARVAANVSFGLLLSAGMFLSRPSLLSRVRMLLLLLALLALHMVGMLWAGAEDLQVATPYLLGFEAFLFVSVVLVYFNRPWKDVNDRHRPKWLWIATIVLTMGPLLYSTFESAKLFIPPPANIPSMVKNFIESNRLQQPHGFPVRISAPPQVACENSGMEYQYSNFAGRVACASNRVWTFLHVHHGLYLPQLNTSFPDPSIYAKGGAFPFSSMNLLVGYDQTKHQLAVNPNPDPRAYLAWNYSQVPNWKKAVVAIRNGHDFHRIPLVENALPGFAEIKKAEGKGEGEVKLTEFDNNLIRLHVTADAPALLVLAEPWFPGWEVMLGDKQGKCFPVNGWMRGTLIPAGVTDVTFTYHSRFLILGILVSMAFACLWIYLWWKFPCKTALSPDKTDTIDAVGVKTDVSIKI